MNYRILGLDPAPFLSLYGMPDTLLITHGILRMRVDAPNAYPDRIELRDAMLG